MENIYLSLGCSLSRMPGWYDDFNNNLNEKLNLYPLAEGSSSNLTQVYKLKNHILNLNLLNKLDKVVLLWQLTSPQRKTGVIDDIPSNQIYKKHYKHNINGNIFLDFFNIETAIFKSKCIGLLDNNMYLKQHNFSIEAEFEQLIFDIMLFSKLVKKIVIWYGWKNLYDQNKLEKINSMFRKNNNIYLIEPNNSIIDWCRENNLNFLDSGHPSEESSARWGETILLPIIKKIENKDLFLKKNPTNTI